MMSRVERGSSFSSVCDGVEECEVDGVRLYAVLAEDVGD